MIDWLSPKLLASEVHAVIGAAAVFGLWLLVPAPWTWLGIAIRWWGLVALLAVDFLKEAFWDPVNENRPPQPLVWAGLVDWAFYWLGILIALAIVYARFGTFAG